MGGMDAGAEAFVLIPAKKPQNYWRTMPHEFVRIERTVRCELCGRIRDFDMHETLQRVLL